MKYCSILGPFASLDECFWITKTIGTCQAQTRIELDWNQVMGYLNLWKYNKMSNMLLSMLYIVFFVWGAQKLVGDNILALVPRFVIKFSLFHFILP
jgi:hypothetical protein